MIRRQCQITVFMVLHVATRRVLFLIHDPAENDRFQVATPSVLELEQSSESFSHCRIVNQSFQPYLLPASCHLYDTGGLTSRRSPGTALGNQV